MEAVLLFLFDILLVTLSSLNLVRSLGARKRVDFILSLCLAATGIVIFSTYLLSLIGRVDPHGYLLIHALFLVVSFLITRVRPKPEREPWSVRGELRFLKENPPLRILFYAFLFFAVVSFFLAVYVPSNNWDSMIYHLARVGYWRQYGSINFYPTYQLTQLYAPPNAEILILWPVTFIRSEVLACLVQWFAYMGTIVAVYGVSKELGLAKNKAYFAAFFWAAIPEAMLQATSTQNDMVITFYIITSIYFLLRVFSGMLSNAAILSGAAFALAIGTKFSFMYVAPWLFVGGLLLFGTKLREKGVRAALVTWFSSLVVSTLLLGAYNYIQSYIVYGFPLGPKKIMVSASIGSDFFNNLVYVGYRFLDTSAIPFLDISGLANVSLHEDAAGYGLLWLLLGVTALFYMSLKTLQSKDTKAALIILCTTGYILTFAFLTASNPWILRLLLPATAIAAPLVGFFDIYGQAEDRGRWRSSLNRFFRTFVPAILVLMVFTTAMSNESKPLIPSKQMRRLAIKNILTLGYHERRSLVLGRFNKYDLFKTLDMRARPGSRIGMIGMFGTDWEYPAFGRYFDREVVPILIGTEPPKAEIFEEYNLDFLIVYTPYYEFFTDSVNPGPGLDLTPLVDALAEKTEEYELLVHQEYSFVAMQKTVLLFQRL